MDINSTAGSKMMSLDYKSYRIFGSSYQLAIGKFVPVAEVISIGTAPIRPKILKWGTSKFYKDTYDQANNYAVYATIKQIDKGEIL